MTEEQLIQQIMMAAFADELEKVSAARGLGLDRSTIEKLARRKSVLGAIEAAGGYGPWAKRKAKHQARRFAPRSAQGQVGKGAKPGIEGTPTYRQGKEKGDISTPRSRAHAAAGDYGPTIGADGVAYY